MRWVAALWLAMTMPAMAQFTPPSMLSAFGVASTKCGPGDVTPFSEWMGLSTYSCAKATALANAIQARRASDSTTQDVPLLSNGNLNIASANTFAGPDGGTGVCTASTVGSSTTLTIATCATSATLHAGDTLTCTACVQPVKIASLGTFSGSGAGASGTVTLNTAQTITAQSVTSQVALFISKWYDQSGVGVDLPQATAALQAQLLPNCGTLSNGLPCAEFIAASTQSYSATLGAGITQPWSTSAVAQRVGTTASAYLSGAPSAQLGWDTANVAFCASDTVDDVTKAASDNATHSIQCILTGGSSFGVVDGSVGSTGNGGVTGFPTTITIGEVVFSGTPTYMTGYVMTVGLAAGAFTSGQYGAMRTLDAARWGTP